MAVRPLETVLADWLTDADALDRTNNAHDCELIRRFVGEVKESADDYLTFLDETRAVLHSGKAKDWLRARHAGWMRLGHAKLSEHGKSVRLYRRCILPMRANVGRAMADAARAARDDAR